MVGQYQAYVGDDGATTLFAFRRGGALVDLTDADVAVNYRKPDGTEDTWGSTGVTLPAPGSGQVLKAWSASDLDAPSDETVVPTVHWTITLVATRAGAPAIYSDPIDLWVGDPVGPTPDFDTLAAPVYVGDVEATHDFDFLDEDDAPVDVDGAALGLRIVKPDGTPCTLAGVKPMGEEACRKTFADGELDQPGRWTFRPTARQSSGEIVVGAEQSLVVGSRIIHALCPGQISGPGGWYRADMGVTLSSGRVSQWDDLSAHARHVTQTTPGDRPIRSSCLGQDAIAFTAAGEFLSRTGLTGLSAGMSATVFIVGRLTSLAALAFAFDMSDTTATNRGLALFFNNGAGAGGILANSLTFRAGNAGGTSDVGFLTLDIAQGHAWVGIHDSASRFVVADGVARHTGTAARPLLALDRIRFGLSWSGTLPWVGEICEVAWWPRALRTWELLGLSRYAKRRYRDLPMALPTLAEAA